MNDLKPLNVERTVSTLDALYTSSGPRLGCALVEANAILTVAGARGDADLSIYWPTPADLETLERLQPTLAAHGLRWDVMPNARKDVFGRLFRPGLLSSLEGYARSSQTSHLSGITAFDAATGWEGFARWNYQTFHALQAAYPEQYRIIWDGFTLGYPDQALLDFSAALETNSLNTLERVALPATSHYVGAQPLFSYAPEHANEPQVAATRDAWQTLLEGVYASVWHQALAADPQFQAARKERERELPINQGKPG